MKSLDELGGLPAFFRRESGADGVERFVPTELTRGPWSAHHQHGGPPSALLAGALERVARSGKSTAARITRVTVELLRPVPLEALRVEARLLKDGRKGLLCGGSVYAGEHEVLRATAAAMRTEPVDLPPESRPPLAAPAPPGPDEVAAAGLPPFLCGVNRDALGYHRAMEIRLARGRLGSGLAAAWMRMRRPLVAGVAPTPLERVLCAADSSQGVSMALPVSDFTFVNSDLTVYVHRPLAGEWVCLDARSLAEPDGTGLADALLWDPLGPIGRALQGLLVERRGGG